MYICCSVQRSHKSPIKNKYFENVQLGQHLTGMFTLMPDVKSMPALSVSLIYSVAQAYTNVAFLRKNDKTIKLT